MCGIVFKNATSRIGSWRVFIRKFIVHFRRPQDYSGKYGFDWLRDEYIHPIYHSAVHSAPIALCRNLNAIKAEYSKDVINPITPYGNEYYPAWLAIFPHTTNAQFADGSAMHKNGVDLDLEIEEIDTLIDDGTKIIFECNSPYIILSVNEINIKDVVSEPQSTKVLSTVVTKYRTLKKAINVKCVGGALTGHAEIKVYAQLGNRKNEIGKLMLYKNNDIPKAKFVVVNVITAHGQASLSNDYEHLFKFHSFNQALIRAEIDVSTIFDITKLPTSDIDVNNFITNYCDASNTINPNDANRFLRDIIVLYERYGKHTPSSGINAATHQQTFLFYTKIQAQQRTRTGVSTTNGVAYLDTSVQATFAWGNCYVVFSPQNIVNLNNTIIHEAGHSLSLLHPFSVNHPYPFIKGTTENVMDYSQQGDNVYTANPHTRKYVCFWKNQWDTMRNDQSVK